MHPDFRTRLLNRERLIGTLLTLPSPELAEICTDAGFDWLLIDMEHGVHDTLSVQRIAQAVGEQCPCIVRVPLNDEVWIKKVLDVGVAGLLIPHVNTGATAAYAVHHSKYPPNGARSIGLSRAHRYGARFQEYLDSANENTAVVVQVEHVDSVRNLEEILGVEGVDGVFVGPYDLSASMNKPGQLADPQVQGAIEHIQQVCTSRNVPTGIFAGNTAAAKQALEQGYTLLGMGSDASIFSGAVRQVVEALR
jgi:4-hydroxy-2-oxoheptanedioate aldolase